MSDYEFKCNVCDKWINVHSTRDVPEVGDSVKCPFCKNEYIVDDRKSILSVIKIPQECVIRD